MNSSAIEVSRILQIFSISFLVNEDLLSIDENPVYVLFSSNCTDNLTVAFSNPVLVVVNNRTSNNGQCQYSVQVLNNNSQAIGYPIHGSFELGLHFLLYKSITSIYNDFTVYWYGH